MKKRSWKLLALMLSLGLTAGMLTACGGENAESGNAKQQNSENEKQEANVEGNGGQASDKDDEPISQSENDDKNDDGNDEVVTVDLENTIWYVDGQELIFYERGSVWLELDLGEYNVGSYEWDGQNGTLSLDDGNFTMRIESEDAIIIEIDEWDSLPMEYMGVTPEQNNLDLLNTRWLIEDVYYNFYDDGMFEVTEDDMSEFGGYEWDGVDGLIQMQGVTVGLYFRGNYLYTEIEEGYVAALEYDGYSELEEDEYFDYDE